MGKDLDHLEKWRVNVMDLGLKNAEGYYDLTAYEAIKNISQHEKRKFKDILHHNMVLHTDIWLKLMVLIIQT